MGLNIKNKGNNTVAKDIFMSVNARLMYYYLIGLKEKDISIPLSIALDIESEEIMLARQELVDHGWIKIENDTLTIN